MSFTDVIKRSVLERINANDIGTTTIAVVLAMALLGGLYIYFIYRVTSKSGFYSRSFNKSLAILPVITAGIVLGMQSNLVISLGMVGALSIVRFRNAVKEPADLTFLFWSISVGILAGAELYELEILLCLCVTVLIFGLDLLPAIRMPYLLVISGDTDTDEKALLVCAGKFSHKVKVRSRSVTPKGTDWILELQVKDALELVRQISEIQGVSSVNLLSHDGEVRF